MRTFVTFVCCMCIFAAGCSSNSTTTEVKTSVVAPDASQPMSPTLAASSITPEVEAGMKADEFERTSKFTK